MPKLSFSAVEPLIIINTPTDPVIIASTQSIPVDVKMSTVSLRANGTNLTATGTSLDVNLTNIPLGVNIVSTFTQSNPGYIQGASSLPVTAYQGGGWIVGGGTVAVANTSGGNLSVTFPSAQAVSQSGAWSIGASTITVVGVNSSTIPVSIQGIPAVSQSGNWSIGNSTISVVGINSSTIPVSIQGIPAVSQSGDWKIGNSTISVVGINSSTIPVSVTNTLTINSPAVTQSGLWSISASTISVVGINSSTIPVSIQGVPAVSQSGTWTVQPGNTQNTTAWIITPTTQTLKTASFGLSATGTIIAAVTGKRLRVYAVKLNVSAAISVNFRDGGASNLEGAMALVANGGFVENVDPPALLFQTSSGNSLDLVISGAGTAAGRVSYWEE